MNFACIRARSRLGADQIVRPEVTLRSSAFLSPGGNVISDHITSHANAVLTATRKKPTSKTLARIKSMRIRCGDILAMPTTTRPDNEGFEKDRPVQTAAGLSIV